MRSRFPSTALAIALAASAIGFARPEAAFFTPNPTYRKLSDVERERRVAEGALEVAIVSGGCFWGVEQILQKVPGVVDTDVGYTGGATEAPTYKQVRAGKTGHVEAVRVFFDPRRLPYEVLLERWFFRLHDPRVANPQNGGTSHYRSAIFATSAAQREAAEAVKRGVDASGRWSSPVGTEIGDAATFTLAEPEHQDYFLRHPGHVSCHYVRK